MVTVAASDGPGETAPLYFDFLESLMSALGILLIPLIHVLQVALNIYMWIVIISALISWVNPDPYNPIIRFLRSVTEPVYSAIRKRLPFPMTTIDFTPMLVILAIIFVQEVLTQLAMRAQ
jgi:YggT family protein